MRHTLPQTRQSKRKPFLGVELLEGRDVPATFTVANLNDAGSGTLREAIGLANAMPDADIIRFDPSIAGKTITLTNFADFSFGFSGLLISTPVTIVGSGQTIFRDSTVPFRLFAVSNSGTLSLQNLTLMNGFAQGGDGVLSGGGAAGLGGAIYNQGSLTISGSTLSGNQAVGGLGSSGGSISQSFNFGGGGGLAGPGTTQGGPPNGGIAGVNKLSFNGGFGGGGAASVPSGMGAVGNGGFGGGGGAGDGAGGIGGFGGGGGGTSNTGSVGGIGGPGGFGGGGGGGLGAGGGNFENAGSGGAGSGLGGAIFNQGGAVTITNSTIAGNAARGGNSSGKGQNGGGYGGGVFNLNGSTTLTNTTIAGNTVVAGTGGVANTANGGALYNASVNVGADTINQTANATINNSILSHTSIIGSSVSNFQDAASKGTASLVRTGPSILIGSLETNGSSTGSYITIDPNLGPLQDNGGFTQTMLPNAGSSAIDTGVNTSVPGFVTDQRGPGYLRVFNGKVDIGAVEVQPAPLLVVVSPATLPAAQLGTAYSQTITATGPAGPFTFTVSGGTLPSGLTLTSSGSLAGTPTGTAGTATFAITATNATSEAGSRAYSVVVSTLPPPPPPGTVKPVLVGFPQFAAGSDVGGSSATLYNPDKSVRFSVAAFAGFTGGVRTASADFNGDGVADLIVGTGPGIATRVVILDGKSQAVLFDVAPFEASFKGGVYVSAGDVTGDGIPDLAITPDEGGGPRVDIYSGAVGFPKVAGFFGIDDVNFRGGARSAIADMTGDGVADLIVVAGFGGGPRVAAFDGKSLATTPVKIFGDFFAFEQALRNGIFVTAGDINGDGFADLIAGGGPGGGPRVLAFDGKSLLSNQYVNLANFFGGDVNSRGGIRVAVKNLDGDNRADLVVGSGSGAGSRVTGYLGKNIAASGTPPAQFDFDSISGFTGGVFVG